MADESLALIAPQSPGAADTLLEAGEEPTDPFLRRKAGPASILIRTERWWLGGEGLCPALGVTSWGGRLGVNGSQKERKPFIS
ncbi:hypothetical protein BKI49_25170 [Streptomyces sp. Tue6028]|nr:hypothetical protein BKI49_25170 [Streptomyces sp. Tue6028]